MNDFLLNSPMITLSNSLRVLNFSSPHSFEFDTGQVLPACSPTHAEDMKLLEKHKITHNGVLTSLLRARGRADTIVDVEIDYQLSSNVAMYLSRLADRTDQFDIALVPLPVLQIVRNTEYAYFCRGIKVIDRVSKIISSEKFCV